ncbi:MAG: chloramphenicol acetyltransferase [Flavitalea sp.]
MRTKIDIENWIRKDHFRLFTRFEEPFFGVTVNIDCTGGYKNAKEQGVSFFLYYLYRALKAANSIENFRYRIFEDEVFLYDKTHASPTINRPDGSFGFGYMDYEEDEKLFIDKAMVEKERVSASTGLVPSVSGQNVIHISALPWLNFTSISHARAFSFPDSCPKISFGKMNEVDGKLWMPVSIHVHHGLMDGFHVAQFVERFEAEMK